LISIANITYFVHYSILHFIIVRELATCHWHRLTVEIEGAVVDPNSFTYFFTRVESYA